MYLNVNIKKINQFIVLICLLHITIICNNNKPIATVFYMEGSGFKSHHVKQFF